MNWVTRYESADGMVTIENRDGIEWNDAPLPRRLHRHVVQTKGWLGLLRVERCACGAARLNGEGPWSGRNERRKDARRPRVAS